MKLSLKTNQRGIAHVALIAGLLVIAVIAGIGYYVYNKQKDSGSASIVNASSSKEVTDACNKELNDKEFCKFAGHWTGSDTYKAVMTSTDKDGTSVVTLEAESKTKTRMTTVQNNKEISSAITIDNTTYIKDYSDNQWFKYTTEQQKTENVKDDIKIDFNDSGNTTEGNKVTYKKIGSEKCDKLTCLKYQIIDSTAPNTQQFVWFDTKDYLLRRWSYKDADTNTDSVFSYDKVSISAPSPVKESTTINSNTSAEDLQKAAEQLQAQSSQFQSDSADEE